MIALLRYQTAILLRSHRWIFPLIAYGLLVIADPVLLPGSMGHHL